MTTSPFLPPAPPRSSVLQTNDSPADLLKQALHGVMPTSLLDLLLDRIEAAR